MTPERYLLTLTDDQRKAIRKWVADGDSVPLVLKDVCHPPVGVAIGIQVSIDGYLAGELSNGGAYASPAFAIDIRPLITAHSMNVLLPPCPVEFKVFATNPKQHVPADYVFTVGSVSIEGLD